MKILHISDTHSFFPDLEGDFDVVVHSGDWLPNKPSKLPGTEAEFQEAWITKKANDIKVWLKGKPLLFCQGNHDFIDNKVQERILVNAGINAICLDNKIVKFRGYNFYGFPYVTWIDGAWSNEKTSEGMLLEVDKLVSLVNKSQIDIIVAHSPPGGVLDEAHGGNHFGNNHMTNAIIHKFTMFPKAYLCGHIHEQGGKAVLLGDMLLSNAATSQRIIDME